ELQTPAIRWYIPEQRALVLGNGQSPTVVDAEACHAQGMTVYRRSSGGTAVLVEKTLISLDIALPHGRPLASDDVTQAYRWVGEAWAQALRALGIAARAIPTDETRAIAPLALNDPLRLACYGSLSPWEVVVDDALTSQPRKLVGLCQVRRRFGALFQTGVYLRLDAGRLASLLALPTATQSSLAGRLRLAAVGLADATPGRQPPTAGDVVLAVERELAHVAGGRLADADWAAAELATADTLEHARFQPVSFDRAVDRSALPQRIL
ncbi:MAG TPA: hypothetical protein VKQ36_11720, partial [Ktedonobacterales bacterium]|nr:hypothetical protein [Ktedonobacterales bacterium]